MIRLILVRIFWSVVVIWLLSEATGVFTEDHDFLRSITF